MSQPDISILLPFHREEVSVFKACVESVRAQTCSSWTCLLLGDGAHPALVEMARELERDDPRFSVHTFDHRGIVDTLNFGLEKVETPFTTRMDADDICHPDRLHHQLHLARQHTGNFLISSKIRIQGGMARFADWVNAVADHDAIVREALVDCGAPHPTWFFPTKEFRDLGGYRNGPFPEDYELFLRMVDRGWRFLPCPEILLTMTHHRNRLTKKDVRYTPESFRFLKWEFFRVRYGKRRVVKIIGGGITARAWLRMFLDEHNPVEAVLDIRPTRIGKNLLGVPVWTYGARPFSPKVFYVVALPRLEQRDQVRRDLRAAGLEEQKHFICVT